MDESDQPHARTRERPHGTQSAVLHRVPSDLAIAITGLSLLGLSAACASRVLRATRGRVARPTEPNALAVEHEHDPAERIEAEVRRVVGEARVTVWRLSDGAFDALLSSAVVRGLCEGRRQWTRVSDRGRRLLVPMAREGALLGAVIVDLEGHASVLSEAQLERVEAIAREGAATMSASPGEGESAGVARDLLEGVLAARERVRACAHDARAGRPVDPEELDAARDALDSVSAQVSTMLVPRLEDPDVDGVSLGQVARVAIERASRGRPDLHPVFEVPDSARVRGDAQMLSLMLHSLVSGVLERAPLGADFAVRLGGGAEGLRLEVSFGAADATAPRHPGQLKTFARMATARGWWLRRVAREGREGVELIFPASMRESQSFAP